MYSKLPSFLFGFHGCDKSVGLKLINREIEQNPSTNNYDWLGNGMYFWEHNEERAWEYVKQCESNPKMTKGKIKEPFVIGAFIDLGHCLNLLESGSLQIVKQGYELLKMSSKKDGLPLPENKVIDGDKIIRRRNLDCAVLEAVHEYRKDQKLREYDSVRGVFLEGDDLYKGAADFKEQNHIQICVRNPNCIKGYFLPRKENNSYPLL